MTSIKMQAKIFVWDFEGKFRLWWKLCKWVVVERMVHCDFKLVDFFFGWEQLKCLKSIGKGWWFSMK